MLSSIQEVLDTGQIVFRYMPPEQEAPADLSAILKEQLKRNAEKFDRIKEAYRNGVDTLEEYRENKRLVQEEKEIIEKQLEEAAADSPEPESLENNLLEQVKNVYDIIRSDAVDNTAKNEILKSVIEKIVYNRDTDELKVYYYYRPQPQ